MRRSAADRLRESAIEVLASAMRTGALLEQLQWGPEVKRHFFAARARRLPTPTYPIDRAATRASVSALLAFRRVLRGSEALTRMLRGATDSALAAHRMLLAVETPRFYELSCRQYGGARSMALDADSTNLDLARHIGARLGQFKPALRTDEATFDARTFVATLSERIRIQHPGLEVAFAIDSGIAAKVMAGVGRVRVREDARFSALETESLWLHEIETHVITGQNGKLQRFLPFLKAGGPRSTRTQEGLAVFSELHGRALGIERLRRLVERVELVAMVEEGANFLDVYRHVLNQGRDPDEAYLDAMRVFRGAPLDGGAPFTKDACYLSGLAEVYNFLRICMNLGAFELAEVLVSGRLALDDLDELVELRRNGLLTPPRHLPSWLRNWEELVAYFAFTSFLNEIELPPLERRFARVRNLVRRAQSLR